MKKSVLWVIAGVLLLVAPAITQEEEIETPPTTKEAPAPATAAEKRKAQAPVTINFVDMELSEIITNISKITGKNFIWDEKIRGKVTIISPTGIPVEEAFRVFEAVLRFNGYQLVPVPGVRNLYKIMRIQEITGQPIPTYLEGKWSPPTEAYITRLLPLTYLDVNEAAAVLNNLKSPEGKILPYAPTNTMIIIESANNLNRLIRILSQMDIPMKKPSVRIVKLKYAPVDQLAGELNQIFAEGALGLGEGLSQQSTPSAPNPPGSFSPGAPQNQPISRRTTPGGKGTPALKIIADTRTNSLIIIAMSDLLDEVLRVINELDVTVEGEGGIYVYYCRNATAKDLAGTLTSLAGGSSARSTTPGRPGTPTMGIPGVPGAPAHTTTATTGPAGGIVQLGTLTDEVRITADEPTNSLVIVANKHDYEILLQVIKKLDMRRRQVFVEAVIVEIELDKSGAYGTSFATAQAVGNDAALFASTALGGLNSLGLLSALQTGTISKILPGGFSLGAMTKTVTINLGGTPVQIPTFSAVFNALVANNNVNVLSTPNLLTTDNEKAEIVVGTNVPIPTGSTIGTGVTTTTIERQNIGIKLTVTPQISESATIKLIISTEISGVTNSAVAGIDVNTLGITTTIKSASTTVIVDNNQTVVIGGLIQERETLSEYKVPLFGDIPFIGWLFKSANKTKGRTNLVILLTPHIVRDAADMNNVTSGVNARRRRFLEEATGGTYREPFYLQPLILPESRSRVTTSEEDIHIPINPSSQPPAPSAPSAVPIPPEAPAPQGSPGSSP